MGLDRLPHRLELHRSLCVRRTGFRQQVWSEPLSRATGRRGRHSLERWCLRAGSISSECGDGIAGRRRTACTREASRLISCSVRVRIRFGTNTKCQCTPSISDDWDDADPERALSNRMTRSAQIARDGRWPCLARETHVCATRPATGAPVTIADIPGIMMRLGARHLNV